MEEIRIDLRIHWLAEFLQSSLKILKFKIQQKNCLRRNLTSQIFFLQICN